MPYTLQHLPLQNCLPQKLTSDLLFHHPRLLEVIQSYQEYFYSQMERLILFTAIKRQLKHLSACGYPINVKVRELAWGR